MPATNQMPFKPIRVILYQPEIPQNTGNIARTCAATQTPLHLIEPLGFRLKDKYLKRAGLDYWDYVELFVHRDFDEFLSKVSPKRCLILSKRGKFNYYEFMYEIGDCLIFGSETKGLPDSFFEEYQSIKIPMLSPNVRSLNLSTSVGIVLYHVLMSLKLV